MFGRMAISDATAATGGRFGAGLDGIANRSY